MRNKFILVAVLTAIFMAICSFGANAQKRISEIDFNIRVGIGFYENFWHMGISKVYNTPRFSDRHNYGGMTRNRYICKKEENQNGKTI